MDISIVDQNQKLDKFLSQATPSQIKIFDQLLIDYSVDQERWKSEILALIENEFLMSKPLQDNSRRS